MRVFKSSFNRHQLEKNLLDFYFDDKSNRDGIFYVHSREEFNAAFQYVCKDLCSKIEDLSEIDTWDMNPYHDPGRERESIEADIFKDLFTDKDMNKIQSLDHAYNHYHTVRDVKDANSILVESFIQIPDRDGDWVKEEIQFIFSVVLKEE